MIIPGVRKKEASSHVWNACWLKGRGSWWLWKSRTKIEGLTVPASGTCDDLQQPGEERGGRKSHFGGATGSYWGRRVLGRP